MQDLNPCPFCGELPQVTKVTDDERREVARRLRDRLKTDGIGGLTSGEFGNAVYFSVMHGHRGGYGEAGAFLANLIEPQEITGETSDGYHTFNELYDHRAKLFSVIVRCFKDRAWKSKLHHDGTMYEGMFIVGIETPQGQATYHYDTDSYWNVFDCKELARAPEWDGHTPEQAISRIASLRPSRDRDTPQKVAEEMFGKMRHSTKEEADAYDAMLKSKSVEIHSVNRDALLEQVKELEKCAWYFGLDFDEDEPLRDRLKEASEDFAGSADRIRKALGVER